MSIFNHLDSDDDELEARTHNDFPNDLFFDIARGYDNENSSVRVDRDAVLRLHAALGEWLYPVHTPEWANKSLIEQMIEKAVKDQVAAVLPLHLKPGDRLLVADADGRVWADPEPHDVGHAEEPVIRTHSLMCPRMTHVDAPCTCVPDEPTDHGRLMSELPRRTRPRYVPACIECLHGWGEHTGGICWGEHAGNHCTCTRERPVPPSRNWWNCGNCGHPNSIHVPSSGECLESGCECRPAGTS